MIIIGGNNRNASSGRWDAELTLISVTYEPDGKGNDVPSREVSTTVFADKKSVGYSEFFKADQAGYKAELKFKIYTAEYDGQQYAEYNGKRYKILRTYETDNGEFVELTLSDLSERGGKVNGEF